VASGYTVPTTTQFNNFTTAYGWGNHSGLYRPISWVPSWTDVTGKPTLFSGVYSDLTGKPTLFSGVYSDLTGKPTIPIQTSATSPLYYNSVTGAFSVASGYTVPTTTQFNNFTTSYGWGNHSGLYRPISWVPSWTDVTGKPTLFSGVYSDLTGKPTIPTTLNDLSDVDTSGATDGKVLKYVSGSWTAASDLVGNSSSGIGLGDLSATSPISYSSSTGVFSVASGYTVPTTTQFNNFTTAYGWGNHSGLYRPISWVPSWTDVTGKPTLFSGVYSDLTGKPTLFSGVYSDLTGKPTIPIQTSATSPLYYNSVTGAFSVASGYTVPTTTQFNNFTTSYGWGNHSGLYRPISWVPSWTDVTGKPTIPLQTSATSPLYYESGTGIFSIAFGYTVPTTTQFNNFTAAYNWGNHSGLYRPISWVPSWTEVTGKPSFATVATSGSYLDLNNRPTISDYLVAVDGSTTGNTMSSMYFQAYGGNILPLIDSAPTINSPRPCTSSSIYTRLGFKAERNGDVGENFSAQNLTMPNGCSITVSGSTITITQGTASLTLSSSGISITGNVTINGTLTATEVTVP